jgi:hypothetical protein
MLIEIGCWIFCCSTSETTSVLKWNRGVSTLPAGVGSASNSRRMCLHSGHAMASVFDSFYAAARLQGTQVLQSMAGSKTASAADNATIVDQQPRVSLRRLRLRQ